jgi:hypothetical protein
VTATPTERAVIETACRVFTAEGMRERIERMADLKRAVAALELEMLVAATDQPSTRERFVAALSRPGAERALNAFGRTGLTVTQLGQLTPREVADIRSSGTVARARWAAALTYVEVPCSWMNIVDGEQYTTFLEELRRD